MAPFGWMAATSSPALETSWMEKLVEILAELPWFSRVQQPTFPSKTFPGLVKMLQPSTQKGPYFRGEIGVINKGWSIYCHETWWLMSNIYRYQHSSIYICAAVSVAPNWLWICPYDIHDHLVSRRFPKVLGKGICHDQENGWCRLTMFSCFLKRLQI